MGRGPVIANKKEASAKAKGKIFTMHSKLISLAAEKGADISLNTALADAIHLAKKEGVTADVIDRAIKRGAGLDKDATKIEEIFYEGYAPGGVAVIVRALSDNRNRTAPNMRHIFSAFGGNMGETGSVSGFAFEYAGIIHIKKPENMDALEEVILSTNAQDYSIDHDMVVIKTLKGDFLDVRSALQNAGFSLEESNLGYIAKNFVEVTDFDNALKIYKMLEEFDADEDVENVWNTADISDDLWKQVSDFVESKKFRT